MKFLLLLHLSLPSVVLHKYISITSQTNRNKIAILQRKAIRLITNSAYKEHTDPIFSKLRISPLEKILYLNKALFMHAIEFGYNIESFKNVWQRNNTRNISQELRNTDMYILKYPWIEQVKKFPFYAFPKFWNDLGDITFQFNWTPFQNCTYQWTIWLCNTSFRIKPGN
jgi:hypothetical protein